MKSIIAEFRERRAHLSTLRYGDDKGRLLDLLKWLEAQPEVNAMLVELRKSTDVNKLVSPHGFRPKASTRAEIAAIGLYMMDRTKDGLGLYTTASKIHVSPKHRSGKAQDYIDEAMTCYVNPLLDHVEAGLNDLGESVTIETAANLRFSLLDDPAFQSAFPDTNQALKQIAKDCGQPQDRGSWFQVAASCREALGVFVRELQGQQRLTPAPELKQGDTKGILKQLAKERSDTSDALIKLIQAVWDYVQSNVHRQAATKQEALRVYLWTGLLISEVRLLTKSA